MQRVPVEQRHQHRRRGLERAVTPALAAGDEADQCRILHFLQKGRRGVAAGEVMALDAFEEAFGQQDRCPDCRARCENTARARHAPSASAAGSRTARKSAGSPHASTAAIPPGRERIVRAPDAPGCRRQSWPWDRRVISRSPLLPRSGPVCRSSLRSRRSPDQAPRTAPYGRRQAIRSVLHWAQWRPAAASECG